MTLTPRILKPLIFAVIASGTQSFALTIPNETPPPIQHIVGPETISCYYNKDPDNSNDRGAFAELVLKITNNMPGSDSNASDPGDWDSSNPFTKPDKNFVKAKYKNYEFIIREVLGYSPGAVIIGIRNVKTKFWTSSLIQWNDNPDANHETDLRFGVGDDKPGAPAPFMMCLYDR